MTIELINSNYNKLIELINDDIASIKADFIKARNKKFTIVQIKEIIILINKEYNDSVAGIDFENNETEYYCKMDAVAEKLKPFETALKQLESI